MFSSKENKALRYALQNGSIKDIKTAFGSSAEPLSQKEVIQILRLLLGRSNFDFEMVELLKKRQCNLNAPLGDKKSNPEQYTTVDYLSSYGRLSPRLIHEMQKAGYDFTTTNKKGEHAGFYLIASAPINDKIIAALKDKGVDFSKPNAAGQTIAQTMVKALKKHAERLGISSYKKIALNRLGSLFDKRDELIEIQLSNEAKLVAMIDKRLKEIQPQAFENVGIQAIAQENALRHRIAQQVSHHLHEEQHIRVEMKKDFESSVNLTLIKQKQNENVRS